MPPPLPEEGMFMEDIPSLPFADFVRWVQQQPTKANTWFEGVPLIAASILWNGYKRFNYLLDAGAHTSIWINSLELSILGYACHHGTEYHVRRLLERGINPALENTIEWNMAIRIAVRRANTNILKMLLDAGLSVHVPMLYAEDSNTTSLFWDSVNGSASEECRSILSDYGAVLPELIVYEVQPHHDFSVYEQRLLTPAYRMREWLMSGNAKHALALLDCYDAIYRPFLEGDSSSDEDDDPSGRHYDRNDNIFGLLKDRTFDRTRALLPVPVNIVKKGIEHVSIWIRLHSLQYSRDMSDIYSTLSLPMRIRIQTMAILWTTHRSGGMLHGGQYNSLQEIPIGLFKEILAAILAEND